MTGPFGTYFAASFLVFMGLHVWMTRNSGRGFSLDLTFSRSLAAALLVLLGFTALWLWWPLWPQAFLIRESAGAQSGRFVAVLFAHLIADLVWLAYGRLLGEKIRVDLILHHLLGLAACLAAWGFGIGWTLIAVLMTTEMLPVSTGFLGWARAAADPVAERLAQRIGLGVLVFWRLPFWSFLAVVLTRLWVQGDGGDVRHIYPIAAVALVLILCMDAFWVRSYLRLLAKPPSSATRQPS